MKGLNSIHINKRIILSVLVLIVFSQCLFIKSYASQVEENPVTNETVIEEPGIVPGPIDIQIEQNIISPETEVIQQFQYEQQGIPVDGIYDNNIYSTNPYNNTVVVPMPTEEPKKGSVSQIQDLISEGTNDILESEENKEEKFKETVLLPAEENAIVGDINFISDGVNSSASTSVALDGSVLLVSDSDAIDFSYFDEIDKQIEENPKPQYTKTQLFVKKVKESIPLYYNSFIEWIKHLSKYQIILYVSLASLLILLGVLIFMFFRITKRNKMLFYKHFASEEEEVINEQMLNETFKC